MCKINNKQKGLFFFRSKLQQLVYNAYFCGDLPDPRSSKILIGSGFSLLEKTESSTKVTKSDKNYIKSRNAKLKLSLNRFKLFTISLYNNGPHV